MKQTLPLLALAALLAGGCALFPPRAESFDSLLARAEAGDAEAQFKVGKHYQTGDKHKGVEQDYAQAAIWLRKAAEQGHAAAQNEFGNLLSDGNGVEKNLEEAVAWHRKSAEQGNPYGEVNLGRAYLYGEGVERDYRAALSWAKKAADRDLPDGWFAVGSIYDDYRFEGCDYAEAMKWFRKAAGSDDARIRSCGRNSLGTLYEFGQGVERDLEEAERWYRKATEESWKNSVANRNLGFLLASGKGPFWNDDEAVFRLWKACEIGDDARGLAYQALCGEFGLPTNRLTADAWRSYSESMESVFETEWNRVGHESLDWAAFTLGALREHGVFLEKDAVKAVEWYRKAAEHGLPRAQLRLAEMLWTGAGTEKDESAALAWVRRAAEDGSEKSKELLSLLESDGTAAFEKALRALRPDAKRWKKRKGEIVSTTEDSHAKESAP